MEQYLIYGRDALLLSLVAILSYILYKRLVKFLSKGNIETAAYASIDENGLVAKSDLISCSFTIPSDMHVYAAIVSGDQSIEVCNADFKGGQHTVHAHHSLPAGRYVFRMITNNQKLERFFRIP